MKHFSDINVLIWDFDGTLYRMREELSHDIREAEYRVIQGYTGWDREKITREFTAVYPSQFQSATAASAYLCGISVPQAAAEMEKHFDRRNYVTRDDLLVSMFQALSGFKHFMLANGIRKNIEDTLATLGLKKEIFTDIVTSEIVGENKPSKKGFLYILNTTKLAPPQHLMIGDREHVDIQPAKEIGLKTCLVFSDTPGKIADITLPTVYEVAKVVKR